MDFTNINDPAGVKVLLDQLRASQAWQELLNEPNPLPADPILPPQAMRSTPLLPLLEPEPEPETEPEPSPLLSNHISSLLSRLQPRSGEPSSLSTSHSHPSLGAASPVGSTIVSSIKPYTPTANVFTAMSSGPSPPQAKAPRTLNFNQSLPIIARLSEDPAFMEKLNKMYEDQARIERKLWEERTRLLKSQEEKVKVAQSTAAIVGSGLRESDANSLRSSFRKELRAFDCEHVLVAWDALVAKQQSMLEALGVPGMFVTVLKAEREKQQRIVQVLDGLSGSGDEDITP